MTTTSPLSSERTDDRPGGIGLTAADRTAWRSFIASPAVAAPHELTAATNRAMRAAASRLWPDSPGARQGASDLIETFIRTARAIEQLGWPVSRIKEALEPSREIFATAALLERLQKWPRGCVGDFETIEHLLAGANHSVPGTLGWQLEQVVLESLAAQQSRNKLSRQAAECVRTIQRRPDARILSLACGGCSEWAPILPALCDFAGEIVLNDGQPAALDLAASRLQAATSRYRLMPGNVLRVANRLTAGPRFDLVVAGGLFDYLDDRAAVLLLRTVYNRLLSLDGGFLFTNIAEGNSWRPLMEYGVDWPIIERTEDEVECLCLEAGIEPSILKITREATGLTLLVEARHRESRS